MPKITSKDIRYLTLALKLATKGTGKTFPNPMVGAVIVKNGKIIGKGYHHKAGLPHAEIEAFKNAKTSVAGATLYVTLEPCCFYGRTPPCCDAIVKAGISKVICCSKDPNPKVSGKGVKKLRQAGIIVETGALEEQAKILNEVFFTYQTKRRPFIALKFAASLDGKIATRLHDSEWISNEQARKFTRDLRGKYPAILVGANTVVHDNPNLGSGGYDQLDPLRIILDSTLKISPSSQVFRDSNALVITSSRAGQKKLGQFLKQAIDVYVCPGKYINLKVLMQELYKRQIIGVFVEGGGSVLGSFADVKLLDKVYAVHAPIIIGGKEAISAVGGNGSPTVKSAIHLTNVTFKKFGDNIITIGYPK